MSNETAIEYVKKALDLAKADLKQLKDTMGEYLHVDTTNKKAIARYFELKDSGYDLIAETSRQVDIEMAIADLENFLWRDQYQRRRKQTS